MKLLRLYAGFVFILGITVAVSVAMKEPRGKTPGHEYQHDDHSKYLKFSHTFHVKEQGIACEDCHYNAKASTVSADRLLGDHQSCQSCHEEQINNECAFCHTQPDNIVPIPQPARELIFSHEQHVNQSISCETCHRGLDTATVATAANFPSMQLCMDCHGERNVSNTCETCHSDFAGLIPEDHLEGDFRRDHRELTRLAELNISCSTCHTESFCQDCHTNDQLKDFGNSNGELMADPAPRTEFRDTPRKLKLQQVHNLNYRFTHGVDAKSKFMDCSTCHQTQSFCGECHGEGGGALRGQIIPESHQMAGFVTIGRGSGGGLHAELGRQDLETCASCHDVEAADPTCLRCHTETGGVR